MLSFSRFSCVDALVDNWRASHVRPLASNNSWRGVHCHPQSGVIVAICMGPLSRTTNRTMSLTSFSRTDSWPPAATGCGVADSAANPRRVIWITASLGQCGSPWIQKANTRIQQNPRGKASPSMRISNQELRPLLIPALTEAQFVVSTCSKRGSNSCQ